MTVGYCRFPVSFPWWVPFPAVLHYPCKWVCGFQGLSCMGSRKGLFSKVPMPCGSTSAPWIPAAFLSNSPFLFGCSSWGEYFSFPFPAGGGGRCSSRVGGVHTYKLFLHEFCCFTLCGFRTELFYLLTLGPGVFFKGPQFPPLFSFVRAPGFGAVSNLTSCSSFCKCHLIPNYVNFGLFPPNFSQIC
jgi:hypothetical protein